MGQARGQQGPSILRAVLRGAQKALVRVMEPESLVSQLWRGLSRVGGGGACREG